MAEVSENALRVVRTALREAADRLDPGGLSKKFEQEVHLPPPAPWATEKWTPRDYLDGQHLWAIVV